MNIRLLHPGYKKSDEFYRDFIDGNLSNFDNKFVSEEFVIIKELPDFPIYIPFSDSELRFEHFKKMVDVFETSFSDIPRKYMLDEIFWHSILCIYKRDYILENYPAVLSDQKKFQQIVIKDFDWENYLYKGVLAYQYVKQNVKDRNMYDHYYRLIANNFDVFNYIIKYEIFRNGQFLINMLTIIDETGTSKKMKSKIKNRSDLGRDERVGRRVIYEFNKMYPVVLTPMLTKSKLTELFNECFSYYADNDAIGEVVED